MKCKLAIRYSSTVIIHELTEICTNDVFSLEDQTMLQFNYQLDSSHCNFDVVDNALSFSTKVDITIQPSEVKMLNCILHSRCQHHPQLTVHDTEHIQIAPEIFHNPLLNISSVSIFNSSATEQLIKSGTPLFSIQFQNISGIIAFHDEIPKVLAIANQHKDVLNFAFLDIVTKMMKSVGTNLGKSIIERQISDWNSLGQNVEIYKTKIERNKDFIKLPVTTSDVLLDQ